MLNKENKVDLDVSRKVQTKPKEAMIGTCDYKLDWGKEQLFLTNWFN
jgi:hypothetical protein